MKPNFSMKQISAIELLAKGEQQKIVASIIGVAENTVYRWMLDDDFRRLVTEKAKASVSDYVPELLQNLHSLANNAEKESIRYQATRELLYMAGLKPIEQIQDLSDVRIQVVKANEPEPSTD